MNMMHPFAQPAAAQPIILIEISSNTVSLSRAYPFIDAPKEKPLKVKCGLGNFAPGEKTLSSEGKTMAFDTLDDWFENIINKTDYASLSCLATGAIREADDGQDFITQFKERYGQDLNVVAGTQEAYYAARGVQATLDNACGVVFDQGGRSTEFAIIDENGDIGHEISLPLGTFSITEQANPDLYIQDQLKQLPEIYTAEQFERIYAVGGSPKQVMNSLRKDIDTEQKLHGFTASVDDITERAQDICSAKRKTLKPVFHISKSRAKLVPAAARLITHLGSTIDAETITASKGGFREGALSEMADALPEPESFTPQTTQSIQLKL